MHCLIATLLALTGSLAFTAAPAVAIAKAPPALPPSTAQPLPSTEHTQHYLGTFPIIAQMIFPETFPASDLHQSEGGSFPQENGPSGQSNATEGSSANIIYLQSVDGLPANFSGTYVDFEFNGTLHPDVLRNLQNSKKPVAVLDNESGQLFLGSLEQLLQYHHQQPATLSANQSGAAGGTTAEGDLVLGLDPKSVQDHTFLWNILLLLGYTLIIVVSLPGNILVCRIISSTKKLRTTTNILIFSLTVSDIATTLINIPFMCARTMIRNWPFPDIFCLLMPTVQVCSVYVSTLTMAAIGIHRFRAVRVGRVSVGSGRGSSSSPYVMTKTKVIVWIIAIWALSLLLALPHSMFNKVVDDSPSPFHDAEGHSRPARRCRAIYPKAYEENLPLLLSIETALTQFLLPLTITAILYTKIALIIQRQGQLARHFCDELNRRICEAKRKRISMLIIVVGAFALSWAPLTVYHLLIDFHLLQFNYSVFMILHQMAMLSVCYNPFIYCWMNEAFRVKAKKYLLLDKLFPCCCLAERRATTDERRGSPEVNSASTRLSSFARPANGLASGAGGQPRNATNSTRMIKRICTFHFLTSCLRSDTTTTTSATTNSTAPSSPNSAAAAVGDRNNRPRGSSASELQQPSAFQVAEPTEPNGEMSSQPSATAPLAVAVPVAIKANSPGDSGNEAASQRRPSASSYRFNVMVSSLVERCAGAGEQQTAGKTGAQTMALNRLEPSKAFLTPTMLVLEMSDDSTHTVVTHLDALSEDGNLAVASASNKEDTV